MKNGAKWVNRSLAITYASIEYNKSIASFPTYKVEDACEHVICVQPGYQRYVKNPENMSDQAYGRFVADVRKHLHFLGINC